MSFMILIAEYPQTPHFIALRSQIIAQSRTRLLIAHYIYSLSEYAFRFLSLARLYGSEILREAGGLVGARMEPSAKWHHQDRESLGREGGQEEVITPEERTLFERYLTETNCNVSTSWILSSSSIFENSFNHISCTRQSSTCARRALHMITLSNSMMDTRGPLWSTSIPSCDAIPLFVFVRP